MNTEPLSPATHLWLAFPKRGHLLPCASNWDRMPPEICRMILRADRSLLSKLVYGELTAYELSPAASAESEQLWHEVFEADWQGGLSKLPRPCTQKCFLAIRTKAMLDQVLPLNIMRRKVTRLVAIKNGCREAIENDNPHAMLQNAIRVCALWLMRELVDEWHAASVFLWPLNEAAKAGHLEAFIWVESHLDEPLWDESAFSKRLTGCVNGCTPLQHFVEEHPLIMAMRVAAQNGHLRIVECLCKWADALAATVARSGLGNAAEVLERIFSAVSDLSMLRWAHAYRLLADPQTNLSYSIRTDQADLVRWLHRTLWY
ncbi:hypothetical protein HK105_204181 [Polyrhizophydium stewartii]|uniref:Ankyrin repeat protein n=1 Tax=Polyrhizophydium stewartii TaxID=2732419 RepID=A0ABR4N979_9FUNG